MNLETLLMKKTNRVTLNSSISSFSADDTIKIGVELSEKIKPGSVVALTGSLGAGKTTFVKGVASGLGIKSEITSPSFTIIKEYYEGRIPLYHMDLYRIGSFEELYMIGFEELIYGVGLSIIEWSEKAEELLPSERIDVDIAINNDGSRQITTKGLYF